MKQRFRFLLPLMAMLGLGESENNDLQKDIEILPKKRKQVKKPLLTKKQQKVRAASKLARKAAHK